MLTEHQTPVDVDTDLIALAMHKLSIDNTNVTDVLTDCNIYLTTLNRSDLLKSANIIDLNLIFDCLNTSDPIQIEMSCSLLKKLLSILPPSQVFNKYSVSIERSLIHPDDIVKSTILSELEKILAVDNNVDISMDLACNIIDCLTNNDMSVSQNAVKCLKKFQSLETLTSLPILSKLQSIVVMDSKIRSRAYDVFIHWADSRDGLLLIVSKGLFSNLVTDVTNHDVMMQLVTIQMLIPLVITNHGFDYLHSVGIIRELYHLLTSNPGESNDSAVVILNPIVLEFFTQLTQVRTTFIIQMFPEVFVVLYQIFHGRDNSLIGAAINSICTLASRWDCKMALDNALLGFVQNKELDLLSIFIRELGCIACSTKTEIKAGAIQAITKIIQVEYSEIYPRNDMITRTQKWYKQIKDNPIETIVHASCVLPFLEIQQAGLEMLLTLAEQPWGQEEINKCPPLLDVVLANCPKDPIIIRDLKQVIIKTLLLSDTSKDNLREDMMLRIQNNANLQSNINAPQPDVLVEDMAM